MGTTKASIKQLYQIRYDRLNTENYGIASPFQNAYKPKGNVSSAARQRQEQIYNGAKAIIQYPVLTRAGTASHKVLTFGLFHMLIDDSQFMETYLKDDIKDSLILEADKKFFPEARWIGLTWDDMIKSFKSIHSANYDFVEELNRDISNRNVSEQQGIVLIETGEKMTDPSDFESIIMDGLFSATMSCIGMCTMFCCELFFAFGF